jgi:hypothetical protein
MRIWVALLIFSFCIPVGAQRITQGASWNPAKGTFPVRFAGAAYGFLHLIRGNASELGILNDVTIEQLDPETLTKQGEWTFPGLFSNRQLSYPEDIRVWNGKLRIFASKYDKQLHQNKLVTQVISSTGVPEPAVDLVWAETEYFAHNNRRFHLASNAENSRLLALSLTDKSAEKVAGIQFSILDTSLAIIKKMKVDLPYAGKFARIADFSIDEPGNVHVLLRWQKSEDSLDIAYSLYAFPIMNEDVSEYELNIPNKQISSLKFALSPDDQLLVAGLARESFQDKDELSCLFYLSIDRESGEIKTRSIEQLDKSLLALSSSDQKTAEPTDFHSIVMQQLLPADDGGALVLLEKSYTKVTCESEFKSGLMICNSHFHRNEIYALHFNKTGEMLWFKEIPKQQHTIDDEGLFLSYSALRKSGDLLFLYNGAPFKTKLMDEPEMNNLERCKLRGILLNGSGELKPLSDLEDISTPFYTGFSLFDRGNYYFIAQPERVMNRLLRLHF